MLRPRHPIALAVMALLALPATLAFSADERAKASVSPVLHLTNGGYVAGDLKASAAASRLGWQSPLFSSPFAFNVAAVNAVHFPLPPVMPKAQGDFRFELTQGDVVFGKLLRWEGDRLEIDISRIGRVSVAKSDVLRINRWRDSTDLVYLGPNGLAGWTTSSPGGKGWYEEFGHLTSDQDGATLRGEFELPARAAIEFEISWKKRPDFVFALGSGQNDAAYGQAWRFEVWDGDLVIQREVADDADLAALQKVSAGPGRAHLYAYLDQELGRCQVYSSTGQPLADLTLKGDNRKPLAGVRLENKHGGLRLERLRIARWAGALPREIQIDKPRAHRTDGTIVYGLATGFDAATREFAVRGAQGEQRVSADQIDTIILSLSDDARPPRSIRALYQDGAQVSGDLVRVEDGFLSLAMPGARDPLRLPVAGLRSLIVLRHEGGEENSENTPTGTLELEGVRVRGRLMDGKAGPAASCLVWEPLGSATASALRPGVSGRIVYREPPPQRQVAQPAQAAAAAGGMRRVVVQQGAVQVLGGAVAVAAMAPGGAGRASKKAAGADNLPDSTGQKALHLRSGDTIPCEVVGIDEEGIRIRTSVSDSKFIPHDRIKAVELSNETASALRLNKVKRERLLTLPRMQRESPPTQLIRSRNGDILRGRVLALDGTTLKVEVRLEIKEIPRDRISQIIWLHPDELGGEAVAEKPAAKAADGKPRPTWNPIEKKAGAEQTPAEEKIVRSLDKPTTVEFLDLPLEDGLTFLKEYHNLTIDIDKPALADAGIRLDQPVTLKLAGTALRDVLKQILQPHDLTYVVEEDVLRITTAEKLAAQTPAPPERVADRVPAPGDGDRQRVQVLRSDGIRLTFFAEEMAAATLSGTSDILGACRVRLDQIDQLLIGGAIEQAASMLAYQQWKLHNALEPKDAGDGGAGDGSSGLESALVGKPAPEFELALLDGKKFRLAETRGRIVVLDFWATWCGPCIQAMPQVDAAVRDFADQGVVLVAVNLEESPKQITAMLARHKLEMTVALDRDGAVGGKYGAEAIPQTVIIDREGKVVRVFVGGGPRFGDQVREALRAVLDPDKKDPANGDPKANPAAASP